MSRSGIDSTLILPEELAMMILDHVEETIPLSHVCRRWRDFVHAHGSFWKTINFLDDGGEHRMHLYEILQMQFNASQHPGLEVWINIRRNLWEFPEEDDEKATHAVPLSALLNLVHLIEQNIGRTTSLAIAAPEAILTLFTKGGEHLFNTDAPLLEILQLRRYPDDSLGSYHFYFTCLSHYPALRILNLHVDLDDYIEHSGENWKKTPFPAHATLEVLVWEYPYEPDTKPPLLEDCLEKLPRLQVLELIGQQDDNQTLTTPRDTSERLAQFNRVAMPARVLDQLDLRQLAHVPYIRAEDPRAPVVQGLVEHFLVPQTAGHPNPARRYPMHLDLLPWDSDLNGQIMTLEEIGIGGLHRAFNFVLYTWLPDAPAVVELATRVTRIALSMKEWHEIFQALIGAPALQELEIRLLGRTDEQYMLQETTITRSPNLRTLILRPAPKAVERPVRLICSTLVNFVQDMISPAAHLKMRLVLHNILWVAPEENDEPEEIQSPPDQLLRSIFLDVDTVESPQV